MWARSFTLRAILAFGFLIGFYLAAAVLALCLLALPLLELKASGRLHSKLAIGCLMGAGWILWSLVPRREKFEPPGPRITVGEHPRLFALIQEVATSMNLAMPEDIYLIPAVNAFVTQSGGLFGFGGRRVMGIGVPLLSALNVSQLKCVVAHEFGHFAGGETRLSGLIYGARSAMFRTYQNLTSNSNRVIRAPFELMLKGFMAITHAISRQQEQLADQWAVQLAGLEAMRTTLRRMDIHSAAYELFLHSEVAPLIALNVFPKNLFEGYRMFIGSSTFVALTPKIESSLKERKTSPYDTHPDTEARIGFAEALGMPELPMDTTPAYDLLSAAARVEEFFSDRILGGTWTGIAWDELPQVYVRQWNRSATRLQCRLPEFRVGTLSNTLLDGSARDEFAEAVDPTLVGDRSLQRTERVRDTLLQALSAYVSSLLCTHGWTCQTAPGEPLRIHRDGQSLDVFGQLKKAFDDNTSPDLLIRLLQESGIDDADAWTYPEDELAKALEPRCSVVLEEVQDGSLLTGPLEAMQFPRCCAICCGPLEYTLETALPAGGLLKQDGHVSMVVPLCQPHQILGAKAWDVRAFDRKTGTITLRLPYPGYARLFPRVNA